MSPRKSQADQEWPTILAGELTFHQALAAIQSDPCRMPKQKEFITHPKPYVSYVGGEGSGKTAALMVDCIVNSMAEPDGLTLVGRLNMTALEGSTMRSFLEMCPQAYGDWADTKKIFTCSNGHQIMFKHLDITDPKIVGHIKSMNLSRAYVDEGSEIGEEIFWVIAGRLRRKSTKRHTLKLASNPAGHDWMWRHFFDPQRREKLLEITHGITASSFDNPFLPKEYLENRVNLYPADWADRFIYGHFSDFSDLVYKEFSEDIHVYDDTLPWPAFGGKSQPPPDWELVLGMDIGSDIDPWAIPVIAVAPTGQLFQFAEVYGNSLLIREIAEQIREKTLGRKIDGIAYDYANRQAALELAEYDISGTPAIKEVRPGLFKTAQYIHVDPRITHPFNPKINGSPRFFVAKSCTKTIGELTSYKWARDRANNPTGEPAHENSHSPDAIRYAIHTFRPLPEKLSTPKLWENPNLDMASRMYWREQEEKRDKMANFVPRDQTPKTIGQWQALAKTAPMRFQRPHLRMFRRFH